MKTIIYSHFCASFLLASMYFGETELSDVKIDAEKTIIKTIFKNYSNKVRPTSQVNINYKLILKQIISLDEQKQIMTSSSNIIL